MQNVKKVLNEVASMFTRFGHIVKSHDIMFERIDKNAEESLYNVKQGEKNLRGAYQMISSNRSLILKVFLMLACFAFVYIVLLG